ncbi:hypothetical protein GGX14DRAFT_522625 [Mycena pura]|uniref:Enoyl reductase (ER) domain-containing protein n=1 Tax=Mycena pura TaxID=153505 RepID=A0AAD6V8A5_9AGAR|nr:hypothetical protein GGX14DRAFT_522625 [Mycena pura]
MSSKLPRASRALVLHKSPADRSPPYHDIAVKEQLIPALQAGQVLVKIAAAAFNHRELWIRKGLYPRIAFGSVLGADGTGTVVAAADAADPLLQQRVFLTPMRGWESNPDGPESRFGTLGGAAFPPLGTFTEYVVVDRGEVIATPAHLTDEQAAAWPLAGVTAWRCVIARAPGTRASVLITGIGGGVALQALQLCRAMGADVYVTSGSQAKIDRAVALGARGGVLYSDADWPAALGVLLTRDKCTHLDAVIDSAGDEILRKTGGVLKLGGRVVCYGMTAAPTVSMSMREVMRNQQLIGTAMGSRADLHAATAFLAAHRLVPVVAAVLSGLGVEAAEEGFEMMKRGAQFGKIVIRVADLDGASACGEARL